MAASILLVEKANSAIDWIHQYLEKKGYAVSLACSKQKAVQQATSETPDLIILNATSSKLDGPEICRALHEEVAEIPIILILEDVMGATFVLTPPFTPRKLFNRIRSSLKSDEGKTLLLVEKAKSPIDWIHQSLERMKYEVSLARSEQEAVQRAASETPDLIILNATSPRIDGRKTCQALHENVAEIPIVSILAEVKKGEDVGGATFVLMPPFTPRKLFNRIRSSLKSDEGKTLLLVEKAKSPIDWIHQSLERMKYEVSLARSEQEAVQRAASETPDLIILNATSSKLDGPEICRALHEEVAEIPTILILGDVMGATFVLTPPFTSRKLFNRIKRVLKSNQGEIMQVGGLTLSLGSRCVSRGSKSTERSLTPKEFGLLKVFMRSPGRVLSRKFLMKKVWKTDYLGDTRTLDVHICWLREKIERNPGSPTYLHTVRAVGYRFDIPEEANEETK